MHAALRTAMTVLVALAVCGATQVSPAGASTRSTRTAAPAPVAAAVAASTAAAPNGPVAIVDQHHGVLIFDLASRNWNEVRPWTWSPGGRHWSNLSDVKFRSYGGRNTLLVTAFGGQAATWAPGSSLHTAPACSVHPRGRTMPRLGTMHILEEV